ncbi:MAG: hypothetical protein ACMUEL_09450 [Flavobacteriales bacterium Tduv]
MGSRTYYLAIKSIGLDQERLVIKDLSRVHAQHLMDTIAHSLYRSLDIIMRYP